MPASMRLLWLLRLFCSCARVVFVVVFLPHSCSRVTLLSVGQAVMALVSTSCNSLAAVRCSCCARHARGGGCREVSCEQHLSLSLQRCAGHWETCTEVKFTYIYTCKSKCKCK